MSFLFVFFLLLIIFLTFSKLCVIIISTKEVVVFSFVSFSLIKIKGARLGPLLPPFNNTEDKAIREVQEIIQEYLQAYKDLQQADVVALQNIEQQLEDIFSYCDNSGLEINVIMDYDFDLRFIINKTPSKYIRLNGGDVNMFLPWNRICDIGGEKNFEKDLEQLLLRIKSINGVNELVWNITHKNQAKNQRELDIEAEAEGLAAQSGVYFF